MKKTVVNLFLVLAVFFCVAISHAAPAAPVIEAEINGLDLTVTWTEVEGATGYSFCFAEYPQGGEIICIDLEMSTEINLTLWEGAAYYFALKAYDAEESSRYSNVELVLLNEDTAEPANRVMNHISYISESIGIRLAGL